MSKHKGLGLLFIMFLITLFALPGTSTGASMTVQFTTGGVDSGGGIRFDGLSFVVSDNTYYATTPGSHVFDYAAGATASVNMFLYDQIAQKDIVIEMTGSSAGYNSFLTDASYATIENRPGGLYVDPNGSWGSWYDPYDPSVGWSAQNLSFLSEYAFHDTSISQWATVSTGNPWDNWNGMMWGTEEYRLSVYYNDANGRSYANTISLGTSAYNPGDVTPTFTWDNGAAPIPEPTTVALLGIGLVGMAGAEVRRRRKKKAVNNS